MIVRQEEEEDSHSGGDAGVSGKCYRVVHDKKQEI